MLYCSSDKPEKCQKRLKNGLFCKFLLASYDESAMNHMKAARRVILEVPVLKA